MPKGTGVDRAALALIRSYQRHLSPHKGFRCAHAAVHGGESCSAAVRRLVQEDGLRAGWGRITARFVACRAAHTALRSGVVLALGSGSGGPQVRGVCCCGPIPIPFRCG